MYEYRAMLLRVVDGDSVHLSVDLGFDIRVNIGVRLAGIDAPEMRTPEGKLARAYLLDILPVGSEVMIRTEKDRREKYGRFLADIFRIDGLNVNSAMVGAGHARLYDGGKR